MEKIRFINENEKIYSVDLSQISSNIIRLNFQESVPLQDVMLGGFVVLNEHNHKVMSTYEGYATIYRTYEDNEKMFELSNDESVYVPPVEPEPEPIPEPTLAEIKSNKISELNNICGDMIIAGVTIDIGETQEHFTYSLEDQANIDDLFQLSSTTGLDVPYHCSDGNCKLYTPEQVLKLYIAQKTNKTHHETYFNQMKQYISSFTDESDKEVVKSISYGQDLTGIYLENYTNMMEQSKKIIEAVVTKTQSAITELQSS